MRAFIFSLDAFVAFTLALIAIYSLIFFSSVPSSYYYLLTQGHYLARDALMSLSTAQCDPEGMYSCGATGSLLDNIAGDSMSAGDRENLVRETVGRMVPPQFGYALEVSGDRGQTWGALYDSRTVAGETHKGMGKKIIVSSQAPVFGYGATVNKLSGSPYWYATCNPDGGELLTCSDLNTDPATVAGGDLVPSIITRLVRVTVFI